LNIAGSEIFPDCSRRFERIFARKTPNQNTEGAERPSDTDERFVMKMNAVCAGVSGWVQRGATKVSP